MSETDRQLVERARDGERRAFEQLVRRHLRAAHAAALAVLGEPADADDVCQDAFISALEHLDDCRRPERFGGWLLRIVRNRAYSARRRQKVRRAEPLEHAATVPGDGDAASGAERGEIRHHLRAALDGLTDVQRQVVLLHDLEGWKHREIADLLDMPVGTVRSHLFYARRALRELLPDELYEEA